MEMPGRFDRKPPERRPRGLRLNQIGFAQHRQFCQISDRGNITRPNPLQMGGQTRGRQGTFDLDAQGLRLFGTALIG